MLMQYSRLISKNERATYIFGCKRFIGKPIPVTHRSPDLRNMDI